MSDEFLRFEVIEGRGGLGKARNRYCLKIAWLNARGSQRRKLALEVFDLFEHGGLLKLVSRCQVLGGPGGAHICSSGQRGSEEELEVLLGDHPAGMQLHHNTLPKLNHVLVLIGRWGLKACG